MDKNILTQQRLKELLDYDHETGVFTRKGRIMARKGLVSKLKGKKTGSVCKDGYVNIGFDYNVYKAHRLAWLYVYGEFPPLYIDHINGIRDDNRIINLRCATSKQNGLNQGLHSTNTSGIAGVSKMENGNYRVCIRQNDKTLCFGVYKTLEEAGIVAKKEYAKLGFHENHGARPAYKL